jgi:Cu/Ag efflux pump CusA
MLEVILDPLALEAYDVTAQDLINAVVNNNQLIAAGDVETASGAISVKIPSSFDTAEDVYDLPITTNGDRVVTLGELADIRLTFQDRTGTARFNGETTVALQVVKRRASTSSTPPIWCARRSRRSAPPGRWSCATASASTPRSTSRCRSTAWSASSKARS